MFSVRACVKFHDLSMYVMELEWLYGSGLLFHNFPKRSSVEILARSSISPEFQVKVNFKVTAFR